MYTLALELSTARCSAALGNGNGCITEKTWTEESRASRGLFPAVQRVLADAGLSIDRVDSFAAGIGPGTFSGLRVAVSVLNGFALPDHKPVCGISSPMALAWNVAQSDRADRVIVAGDARRNHYWYAAFNVVGNRIRESMSCSIVPADQWPADAGTTGVLVTADWERIGASLAGIAPETVHVIREPRHPSASAVLAIVRQISKCGEALPPPVPVYLHPPVAKEKMK